MSFDHTFRIASNIGYVRADKKWVCQYDSAFLVLNGDGKVVSWLFTKGTRFDNVRSLLQQIAKRQSCSIKTIYVDNCCQWRQQICEVFGSNVTVLLDVFYAVQRMSRKMPKRHPFFAACLQDLRMVFRSPGEYGMMPTPPPPQLLLSLNSFSAKWKDVVHNEQYVLKNV